MNRVPTARRPTTVVSPLAEAAEAQDEEETRDGEEAPVEVEATETEPTVATASRATLLT